MYGGAAMSKISLVLELVDNLLHAFFGTSTFMFGGWLLSLCMNNGSFNGLRYGACNTVVKFKFMSKKSTDFEGPEAGISTCKPTYGFHLLLSLYLLMHIFHHLCKVQNH